MANWQKWAKDYRNSNAWEQAIRWAQLSNEERKLVQIKFGLSAPKWHTFASEYQDLPALDQVHAWRALGDWEKKYVQQRFGLVPPISADIERAERAEKALFTGPRVRLALLLVVAAILGYYSWTSPDAGSRTTRSSYSSTSGSGSHVVLRWRDSSAMGFLAVNDAAWREMMSVDPKDQKALWELIGAGKVHPIPAGTNARVLETGFTSCKVRILSGASTGISGWVAREFVQLE